MRPYSSSATAAANTAAKTLWQLIGSTSTRWRVYDIIFSAAGVAPVDNAAEYQFQRSTAASTVTAFTPVALDNGDPATLMTTGTTGCGFLATIEGTYTGSSRLLDIGVNQRATFRWVARERSELIGPASTNGLGCVTNAVNSAFNANLTVLHYE